ncbi:CAP-Gly domain containing linker protein 1 [Dissostichus eleginoides]|uniref:CAP-Gly domain containing linker protein 1 n=1 Tax=Dissostichus eleginoides TaxID=100907 RepID=A0AAD9FBI7_DISEL|nr:CAP-Gly domain containing linker protein 1 [Dissostichus eleginoides]
MSKTNAGAVPDPKTESPVAVEDRLSNESETDVIESGVATTVGAVRCHSSSDILVSEVVCGGRNCSGAATPWPRLEILNRFATLPDEAPAHPSDAAVVSTSPHLEASPSRVAVSPPSPARIIRQPSTGKQSKGPHSAPKHSSCSRRRLLKEAVIKRSSGGLILPGTNPPAPLPQQTPAVITPASAGKSCSRCGC